MSTQKFKIILRHIAPSLVLFFTIFLLLGGVIYMTSKVNTTKSHITSLQSDISELNRKANNVLVGVPINSTEVDQFTQMLAVLIPEDEDFFSVLTTLENLSFQTGYTIVKYSITPGNGIDQKLVLQVQGIGDATGFLNFVKNYSFSGGRFITSDDISFNAKDTNSSTINLTFYTQKTSSVSEVNKKLSQKDVQLLRDIKNKTFIELGNSIASGSGVYTTKSNPF